MAIRVPLLSVDGAAPTATQLLATDVNDALSRFSASVNTTAADVEANLAEVITQVTKQVFTASGTYTPTAGMKYCIVECVGGGAGGGSAGAGATRNFGGGGGGAGGYSRVLLTAAAVGVSKAVTIGAAGAGGSAAGDGDPGGDTSLDTLCVARGGAGGLGTSNGATLTTGGAGGAATGTGDLVCGGAPGGNGTYSTIATVTLGSGHGGSSIFGGGGVPALTTAGNDIVGNPGLVYGSGGSGSFSHGSSANEAGGAGAAGVCFVTEFIKGI